MTTTFGSAVREYQIRCLCMAQGTLGKMRASGFALPEEVAEGIQDILEKIPTLIRRLEYRPELAGTTMAGVARENGKDLGGHDRG